MLFRLAAKLLWGTTKFTVKHVVVPIAITAATAMVLDEVSRRMREGPSTPNGRLGPTMIRPEP